MRATYITACVIGALIILWLASGQLREEPQAPAKSIAEQNRRVSAMQEERAPTRVRVATIHASDQSRILSVRGRTLNKRTVNVQSQIDGLLIERPVERGDVVKKGQLLCKVSVEDREAALLEAVASVDQARIEYEGSVRLSRQGLQSETVIAQSKARLAAAQATKQRAELDINRLNITAPFDGVIEDVQLELGQYVMPGSTCATLADLDPMLLVGNVSENELTHLKTGQSATASLPDGRTVQGDVTFVARTTMQATRTYPIEIQLDNSDFSIPSGVTAQISIPVETLRAQKISPALLVLDDVGRTGVRTVDSNDVVRFNEVSLVGDEVDGVWVTGLPEVSRIIVVGQQLVVAGESVTATHASLNETSTNPEQLDIVGNPETDSSAL